MPGQTRYNASLQASGQGKFLLWCVEIGHGFSIVSSEGETRRSRTFYPNKRTSGEWYLEFVFKDRKQWEVFHTWLAKYVNRASDPYKETVAPIQVQVPSRSFDKMGFPISSLSFGDEFGKVLYRSRVTFTSASDPIDQDDSSQFHYPNVRWLGDSFFAPSGLGAGDNTDPDLPDPWIGVDGPPEGDDDSVYESGGGVGGNAGVRYL